jgi:hypothetical protein
MRKRRKTNATARQRVTATIIAGFDEKCKSFPKKIIFYPKGGKTGEKQEKTGRFFASK